jgi:hypothetical protein
MDNDSKQEKTSSKLGSLLRVPFLTTFSLLIILTALMAYLFFTDTVVFNSKDTECKTKETTEVAETKEDEVAVEETKKDPKSCDLATIMEETKTDISRVSHEYEYILSSGHYYPECKDELYKKIENIFSQAISTEDFDTDPSNSDVKDDINYMLSSDDIGYLIDDTFYIYTPHRIWTIDIREEKLSLLWELKDGIFLQITQVQALYEDDRTNLLFEVQPNGMGGVGDELDDAYKDMCNLETHGLWRYDTATGEATRITPASFYSCNE